MPRRPAWTRDMTAEELDARERDAFLSWRRRLAEAEEEEKLVLTPFEKVRALQSLPQRRKPYSQQHPRPLPSRRRHRMPRPFSAEPGGVAATVESAGEERRGHPGRRCQGPVAVLVRGERRWARDPLRYWPCCCIPSFVLSHRHHPARPSHGPIGRTPPHGPIGRTPLSTPT